MSAAASAQLSHRKNHEPSSSSGDERAAADGELTRATDTAHVYAVGAVLLLHSLAFLSPFLGALCYDGSRKVTIRFMIAFDVVFRRGGTVFPLVCWAPRALLLCTRQEQTKPRSRAPQHALLLHFWIQLARLLVYLLHSAGVQNGLWLRLTDGQHDHILADHVFLGLALQGSLAIELVECVLQARDAKAQPTSSRITFGVLMGVLFTCVTMMMCILVEMFLTGRHFHHPIETSTTVLVGSVLFLFPSVYCLIPE